MRRVEMTKKKYDEYLQDNDRLNDEVQKKLYRDKIAIHKDKIVVPPMVSPSEAVDGEDWDRR